MRTPSWARSRRGSASRSPIRSRGSATWTTPPRGGPAGRGGGARDPWAAGHEGVLEQARGHSRRPPGRLAPHGGRRADGRGRVLLHRGPEEGHDPLLRIQRVPAGGRGGPLHAPGPGGGRGERDPGRVPRGDREGLRRRTTK